MRPPSAGTPPSSPSPTPGPARRPVGGFCGRTGTGVFAEPRPPGAESAAVARTLETAHVTGATCYLVHLSCAEAIEQVRLARRRGSPPLHAEVCLHHLLLDDRCYLRGDAER